eukprot:m.187205 g.187205  ORF g.187205 m.187205 type:complete len:135 (+) comp18500_c0_seq3:313-717(+)
MAAHSAETYLQDHCIPQLLENLTAAVIYHRPHNPKEFLSSEVKKLIALRDQKERGTGFVGTDELKAIFGVFDVPRTGSINLTTYKEAMKAAGISSTQYNSKPQGYVMDRITLSTFVTEATISLEKLNATFLQKA